MNLRYGKALYAFAGFLALEMFLYYLWFSNYAGIKVPFADHLDTALLLNKGYEGGLSVFDFLAFHNEHRPFVPRLLFYGLGRLSDWNISFEFVLLNFLFLIVLLVLLRVSCLGMKSGANVVVFLIACWAVLLPAGHTNWWWSFMLEMVLAVSFALLAFYYSSTDGWRSQFVAGLFSCMSILSEAAGLFVGPSIFALMTLRFICWGKKPAGLYSGFWAVFSVVSFLFYAQGLLFSATVRPGGVQILAYIFVFLGKPFANMFGLTHVSLWGASSEILLPLMLGMLIFLIGMFGVFRLGLCELVNDRSVKFGLMSMAFSVFTAFAVGWGRAGLDGAGVQHANSSPTFLISACFIFGVLFVWRRCLVGLFENRLVASAAIAVVMFSAVFSQLSAISVAKEAKTFSLALERAYVSGDSSSVEFKSIHPDPSYAEKVRDILFVRKINIFK